MMEEIAFTKTALPYGWMGNMAPYPITWDGKVFPRSENLFMALRFDDPDIIEAIRLEPNPMKAKFFAKKHADKMVVEQRSPQDVANMNLVVRLKMLQHPMLGPMLLDTHFLPIYEDVTSRGKRGSNLFWGALKHEDGTWEGENHLGRIWMQIRKELRAKMMLYGYIKYINSSDGFITPVFAFQGELFVQNRMEDKIEFMKFGKTFGHLSPQLQEAVVRHGENIDIDPNQPFYGYMIDGKPKFGVGKEMEDFLVANKHLTNGEMVEAFKRDWRSHEYK